MIKGDLQHNWELLFRNTDLLRDMIDKYYPFKTNIWSGWSCWNAVHQRPIGVPSV